MSSSTSAAAAAEATTKTFETALWLNAAVFAAELLVFTYLRTKFKAIYEPRSYLPTEGKRSQPILGNIFLWPWIIFRADYTLIKERNGMDAYFFVRFLRMMVRVFLPIWIVTWVILLPVDAAGNNSGNSGLDKFTYGNVTKANDGRYGAHVALAWISTFWIWWNIRSEMRHFVTTRQRYLVDPIHSSSAQANTILVTGVPTKFLTERALTNLFSHLPGGVRKVWLNRDLKELPALYNRRLKACNKLESAETSLLHTATKLRNKALKKQAKAQKKAGKRDPSKEGLTEATQVDSEKNMSLAERLVPQKKRPSHRLPLSFMPFSLPFVGKRVDSIEWAREEIVATNEELERGRVILRRDAASEVARRARPGGLTALAKKLPIRGSQDEDVMEGPGAERLPEGQNTVQTQDGAVEDETYPPLSSAFILFNQQIAAHMATQMLTHHSPYRMSAKYTEIAPEDVVWGNLGLNPYEAKLRTLISYGLTAGLIILWAFPVAFIGIVSNIAQLCVKYSWLAWLCKIPSTVLGIIQGILPAVLLSVLMMLLPIVLRMMIKSEGVPTRSQIELSLMTRFFIFEVIHGFLIVTLSSGIIAALPQLAENPAGIPNILAEQLPLASTFFLTYILLQGLSGTASGFLQAVPLILYYVKLYILGSTPRSVYKIKFTMRNVQWGTLFPSTTLIVVIALGYEIISPIINGFALLTFFFFYQMYKYIFLYVYDQPASGDTGGLFFPKAMQHIFVGLYVQQVCLAALFFLAENQNDKPGAVPEGALMVVLIIFTIIFNLMITNSYGPLLEVLPLSLADKSYGMPRNSTDDNVTIDDGDDGFGGADGRQKSDQLIQQAQSSNGKPRHSGEHDLGFEQHHAAQDPATGEPIAPPTQRTVAGKQPVKGDNDYGTGVGVEGKHNEEPTDFYHPAAVEPQRTVWIPVDELGLAGEEEASIRAAGIATSTDNARMDAKGHVDISGPPPGTF